MLDAGGIADVEPLVEPPPAEPRADANAAKRAAPASHAAIVVRGVIGVALVIGVSSLVAWAARRHVLASSRFAVHDVDVTGAHHRTSDEVTHAAGISVGSNIFTVDLDDARAKLLTDPWIGDASFARRLPGTILIQVTEREAGALVALGDTFVASRDGEIFKKLEPTDPVDLPIVTGLRPNAVTDDREGAKRTIRRAIDLAADYEHSSLAKKATLQEIHVDPDGAVTLVVGKGALALALGEPPFRRKLEEAARVMAELEKRGTKADVVMLDNESRPDRVVVRVK